MFSKQHNLIGGFAFIGERIPIGIEATFSSKYRREVLKKMGADQVTLAFFEHLYCEQVHALSKGIPICVVMSELYEEASRCCLCQGGLCCDLVHWVFLSLLKAHIWQAMFGDVRKQM